MNTKVAIPQYGDLVAPRFEAANTFAILTLEGNEVVSRETVSVTGSEGYRRLRLLQIHRVGVLICNGIKASYLDMLSASGIAVFPEISMPIADALDVFCDGKLEAGGRQAVEPAEPSGRSHQELVDTARALFESQGYQVTLGPGQDAFLIDLVAQIDCPVCHRPVRVAICCGAHTYKPAQEIAEFSRATSSGFHARVYMCSAQPSVVGCCREFGIQPIDPNPKVKIETDLPGSRIPLLVGAIASHDQACVKDTENR